VQTKKNCDQWDCSNWCLEFVFKSCRSELVFTCCMQMTCNLQGSFYKNLNCLHVIPLFYYRFKGHSLHIKRQDFGKNIVLFVFLRYMDYWWCHKALIKVFLKPIHRQKTCKLLVAFNKNSKLLTYCTQNVQTLTILYTTSTSKLLLLIQNPHYFCCLSIAYCRMSNHINTTKKLL
jgi:hypothetical protein